MDDVPLCVTLELPNLMNRENVSCIPVGEYKVKLHQSPSMGEVYHLQNVTNRTWIYIHTGNWTHQIKGCILVGSGYLHDGSGISNSVKAFNRLRNELGEEFTLTIHNAFF
jgi:hypothetical protein